MNIKNLKKVLENAKDKAGNINVGIALMLACAASHAKIVQKILTMDVKVNDEGETVLMIASQNGYIGIVQELIANGANVDAKDNDGQTALMKASGCGLLDIVRELITNGANVNAKRNDGWTSLMLASMNRQGRIVRELIINGAHINARNKDGETALARANGDIVNKILINAGAKE